MQRIGRLAPPFRLDLLKENSVIAIPNCLADNPMWQDRQLFRAAVVHFVGGVEFPGAGPAVVSGFPDSREVPAQSADLARVGVPVELPASEGAGMVVRPAATKEFWNRQSRAGNG